MKSLCLCVLVLSLQFVCVLNELCPVKPWDPHPQDRSRYGSLYLTIVQDVKPLPITTVKIVITMGTDGLPYVSYIVQDVKPLPITTLKIVITMAADGLPYMEPGTLTFDDPDTYNGSYFWYFPADGPHPKVTEVSLNGDIICSELEDIPTPTQNVTKLTLQGTWKEDDSAGYLRVSAVHLGI